AAGRSAVCRRLHPGDAAADAGDLPAPGCVMTQNGESQRYGRQEATMRWLILMYLLLLAPLAPARAAEPAGGQIVYSRQEGDRYRLHIMNADGTGDRLLAGPTANVNLFPSWSPDGKRILYASAPSLTGNDVSISIVNADGSGNKVMELPQRPAMFPAWSPD